VRAQPLGLRPGDRELLESWTRSSSIRAGLAQRARIVLLAADGLSNTEIAERVGVSRPTVIGWRNRYASSGVRGLEDEQRSGRPRTVDRAQILAATLTPPPAGLGVTHCRRGCWPTISGWMPPRCCGPGGITGCSRGGWKRSSSLPIQS
jgi:hypothetical protein